MTDDTRSCLGAPPTSRGSGHRLASLFARLAHHQLARAGLARCPGLGLLGARSAASPAHGPTAVPCAALAGRPSTAGCLGGTAGWLGTVGWPGRADPGMLDARAGWMSLRPRHGSPRHRLAQTSASLPPSGKVNPAFAQPRTPFLPLQIVCHLLGFGNQLHPTGLHQPALPQSHHTPTLRTLRWY